MVGWHHLLNEHEFEQAPGIGDGQRSLACCSPWGPKESNTTWQLNNNNITKDSPDVAQWSVIETKHDKTETEPEKLVVGPGMSPSRMRLRSGVCCAGGQWERGRRWGLPVSPYALSHITSPLRASLIFVRNKGRKGRAT